MAKIFNQTITTDARLVGYTLETWGKTWAVDHAADGFSYVDNVADPAPTDIKEYLEGNNTLTAYPVASNISVLCDYALASFTALTDIYLFKTDSVVTLTSNSLANLSNLTNIYVPTDLLNTYKATYSSLASYFKGLNSDYDWTVTYIGNSELTETYMDGLVGMLSYGQKIAITLIHIPSGFTSFEFGATDSLFDGTFANLATIDLQNQILFIGNAYNATQTNYELEVK